MSKAIEFNKWCIVTGEDFREFFFVKDPTLPKIPNPDYDPTKENKAGNRPDMFQAKDLTGITGKMQIRDSESRDGNLVADLETGSGLTFTNATGAVEIFIDNTVTNNSTFLALVGEKVYFDFFLIPPNPEDNLRTIYGSMKVEGTITDVS